MKQSYLPKYASIPEACEWLQEQTGEPWTLARLLDHWLMPWFWLDYSPGWPDAIFGERIEGYFAPMCHGGDTARLAAGAGDVVVTYTRTHDGKIMRWGVQPGLLVQKFPIDELRFMRDDLTGLVARKFSPVETDTNNDEATNAPAVDVKPNADDTLSELFDPVPVETLEKMFPAAGKWKIWAERANANGLKNARDGRARFNPYKAAMWFLNRGREGWDLPHCYRTLAKSLPARSRDEAHLLTGDID